MNVTAGDAVNIASSLFDAPAVEPSALAHVILVVLVVVGVGLWLLGRSITRPLCAVSGLLLGAAATFALARAIGSVNLYLVFVTVGAAIGCLMAWFLFRLWMGVSLAITLAIVAPIVALQWIELTPGRKDNAAKIDVAPLIEASTSNADSPTGGERLGKVWSSTSEQFSEWWRNLEGRSKTAVVIGVATGTVFGLFFGMLAPYWASSGLSALVGTVVVASGARVARAI